MPRNFKSNFFFVLTSHYSHIDSCMNPDPYFVRYILYDIPIVLCCVSVSIIFVLIFLKTNPFIHNIKKKTGFYFFLALSLGICKIPEGLSSFLLMVISYSSSDLQIVALAFTTAEGMMIGLSFCWYRSLICKCKRKIQGIEESTSEASISKPHERNNSIEKAPDVKIPSPQISSSKSFENDTPINST